MLQFLCLSSMYQPSQFFAYQQQSVATNLHSSDTCNAEAGRETVCRGCSALFHAVRGIQKLDLSDTVVRDDAMQAVAQLSNLNNLTLAYSGISAPCTTRPVKDSG